MKAAEWNPPQDSRDVLWMKHPPSRPGEEWKTALPLGNGYVGALFYGAAGSDILRLTRQELWAGAAESGPLPDVSAALYEMRRKMDAHNWPQAQFEMTHALEQSGYWQKIAQPFPLGQLQLTAVELTQPFAHYRRGLCLNRAEAFASWQYQTAQSVRRCFVSQEDGAVWLLLQEERPRQWELSAQVCPAQTPGPHAVEEELRRTVQVHLTESGLAYTAQVEGRRIGFCACVLPGAGSTVQKKEGYLLLEGTEFAVKILTFTDDAAASLTENALLHGCLQEQTAAADYEKAFARHVRLWQPKYEDVELLLEPDDAALARTNEALLEEAYDETAPAALYEKLWCFARYLFLSGTADGSAPFALYGLWAGDYDLPWTQNVANENVQMIYSAALPEGCFAQYRALIHYYVERIPLFAQNARQLFGCRGIFVPAYTAPRSLNGQMLAGLSVPVPVILHWISGAGWLAAGFCDYYRYSGDERCLREEILPFLIETARFYTDYVQWEETGACRLYPSVSPENTPGNLMPPHYQENMGHVCPAVENATMDFAVMKQTLRQLLLFLQRPDCADRASAQERADWQRLLQAIPPYRIDPQSGAVCEWMHPALTDWNAHRHVSHLYPVFPGSEVRRDNAPQLLQAFEKAAHRRKLGSKSGWAFAHMAALWARLGDGEAALGELDLLCKACLLENFFTLHNDWRHMGVSLDLGSFAPVQLDALHGMANALLEMLVCSAENVVTLFPALPARFSAGQLRGLYLPQGRLTLHWQGGRARAVLQARCEGKIFVCLPDGSKKEVLLRPGQCWTCDFALPDAAAKKQPTAEPHNT